MTTSGERFMASFRRSAWRLETLPQYNPRTDTAFQVWRDEGRLLPLEERPTKVAWMALLEQAVREGKTLCQVHVVERPLTPYLEYELATYPENVAAGMEIRIADRRQHPELAELSSDFWLMDDDTDRPFVLLMDYEPDGQFASMRRTEDPAVIAECRRQRDLAVACSVPLEEFIQAVR
jgi:hypothetical protein